MPNHYNHPGGLLQAPQQPQRRPIMGPMGQQAPQFDGTQFFKDAAANLMMTDPALSDDIKGRARALDLQSKQLSKLLQMAGAMGEDVSALAPIAEQLQAQRQKAFRELIGRANVPSSASRPKVDVPKPRMK